MGWLVIGARDLRIALVCPNGEQRRPEASDARRCKRDNNALPRHCGASEPACLRDDPGRAVSGAGRVVSGPGEVDLVT